jgi:GNAT superfamily N-acetyltransferase
MTTDLDHSVRTEYEIARYRPDLKEQILALQRELWGSDDADNAAYFAWKYGDPVGEHAPVIYVAMRDGEVAGMRGFWETEWQLGCSGRTIRLLGAGDLVIAPKHRGLGLFRNIMEFAEADLASSEYTCFVNLSASPITYLGSLKQGWRSVGAYQPLRRETAGGVFRSRLQRSLKKTPLLWRYSDMWPIGTSGYKNALFSLDERISAVSSGGQTDISVERAPRPEAMDRIVERLGSSERITMRRDVRYFSWRYSNPLRDYRFLISNASDPDGYLVLEARTGATDRHINIVDWEATNPDIKKELLYAVVDSARATSLSVWSGTLGADDKMLLRDAGFRPIDDSRGIDGFTPSILIKAIGENEFDTKSTFGGIDAMRPENWDLRMIFSDNY